MKDYAVVFTLLSLVPLVHAETASLDGFGDTAFLSEQVFSAARMDQAKEDTPGAVTVITGDQIRDLGIKTLAEVLRLVPGFNIKYDGNVPYVNRGTTVPTPRRLQVLVDGVSQVNAIVGIVLYDIIPVPLENISKIEVVRSQSTASYGANAFLGSINIVTRHPDDRIGTELHALGSDRGWSGYAGHATQMGNTSISLDYKQYQYDRYDSRMHSDLAKNDDMNVETFAFQSISKIAQNSLKLSAATAMGSVEEDVAQTAFGINYPIAELTSSDISLSYEIPSNNHTVTFGGHMSSKEQDYHWDVCGPKGFFYPALGESYKELLSSGFDLTNPNITSLGSLFEFGEIVAELLADPTSYETVCGETNTDYEYQIYVLEVRDIWRINSQMRLSSALQLDHRTMKSETYGNGTTSLEKTKAFTNMEYMLGNMITLNAGAFIESLGYGFSDAQVSPRVGVNFHLTPYSTVKMVASSGKRLIDGIELIDNIKVPTHFDYEVYGSKVQSAFFGYFTTYNNPNHVESITSLELIYYYQDSEGEFEARIFNEEMTNIYNYNNFLVRSQIADQRIERNGLELSAVKNFEDLTLRLTAYYLESKSDEVIFDQYELYGGSAYIIKAFPGNITTSVGYYGTGKFYYGTSTGISPEEDRLFNEDGRLDLRVSKKWGLRDTFVDVEAIYSYHKDSYERPDYYGGVEDSAQKDSPHEFTLGASLYF